jgi:glucosamine 6-phosphate synthetase-like amidotransferase/phosphosugar isomerase protein
MSDRFHDKCGLFAVYGDADAVGLTLRGLSALQHRGEDSAGVAYRGGFGIERVTALGRVADLAPQLRFVSADTAIGHVGTTCQTFGRRSQRQRSLECAREDAFAETTSQAPPSPVPTGNRRTTYVSPRATGHCLPICSGRRCVEAVYCLDAVHTTLPRTVDTR